MTRSDGFAVMDVATDVANEPKFRRVQRRNPAHVAPAFMAYMAVVGESWKAGRRVAVTDAWPVLLPFDAEVVGSLVEAGLLDKGGMIPAKAWSGWYRAAHERREKARERWKRYNETRPPARTNNHGDTTASPRGSDADTASSVPFRSVPTVPSVPSVARDPAAARFDREVERTLREQARIRGEAS